MFLSDTLGGGRGRLHFSFLAVQLPQTFPSSQQTEKQHTTITKLTEESYICLGQKMGKAGRLAHIPYGATYLLIVLRITGRPSPVHELPSSDPHSL